MEMMNDLIDGECSDALEKDTKIEETKCLMKQVHYQRDARLF